MQNLINIIENFNKNLDDATSELLKELKKDCKTYKEVQEKFKKLCSEVIYRHSSKLTATTILINKAEKELENEKNNLPLTDNPANTLELLEKCRKNNWTINKTREAFGLDPIKDGDTFLVKPSNLEEGENICAK
jgi:hypothetical protein